MSVTNHPGTLSEDLRIQSSQLVNKVKELVAAGNVRKVIVKHEGNTLVEVPLTIGVVGAVLAPQLAALGAIAALISECSIQVVHTDAPTGSAD